MTKYVEKNSTLNMRLSCSTHSATSCVWAITLRLFMIRTIDASIAYLRSLSTSSTTFFFSSTGGRGICKLCEYAIRKHHIDSLYSYKYGTKQIKLEKTRKYLDRSIIVRRIEIDSRRRGGRRNGVAEPGAAEAGASRDPLQHRSARRRWTCKAGFCY